MKELKFNKELIAYALSFVSFIFPKIDNVKEIILFGSVAREEADKNSDIDLFFDVEKENEEKTKEIIKKELEKFYKSKIAEIWFLKGIKNPIKPMIGNLEEWKLKRSIISDGISLYSKYKETPKNMKSVVFFQLEPIKNIAKRNKIIRLLFGRKEKTYSSKGILENYKGKKISPSSFIIDKQYSNELIRLLGKEKINFKFFELWTDQIV